VMSIRTQSGASKIRSDKDAIRAQRKQRKRFKEVEEAIASREERLKQIDAEFTRLDPSDYEPLSALSDQRSTAQEELDRLYEEWTALSEIAAE